MFLGKTKENQGGALGKYPKIFTFLREHLNMSAASCWIICLKAATCPLVSSSQLETRPSHRSAATTVCHTYKSQCATQCATLISVKNFWCGTLYPLSLSVPHLEICIYHTQKSVSTTLISMCHTYICGKLDCTELGNMTHFEVRYYTSVWHPYLYGKPFDLAHFICV